MPSPPQPEHFPTHWHWGPLHFDGLFGLHGLHLCFHRYPDPSSPEALVDPAKDIIPLEPDASAPAVPPASPGA